MVKRSTVCIVCSHKQCLDYSINLNLSFVSSDSQKIVQDESVLFECVRCGHVQKETSDVWKSRASEIYATYNINYQAVNHSEQKVLTSDGSFKPRTSLFAKKVMKILGSREEIDILDFGCGNGASISSFAALNNTKLFAYDEYADYEELKKNFKNVQFLDNLENNSIKFDAIILVHVLEHLLEPRSALENLSQHLKNDGFLFVQIPNPQKNPFDYLIWDHCSHFFPGAIEYLADHSGLELVEISETVTRKELFAVFRPRDLTKQKTKIIRDDGLKNYGVQESIKFLHYKKNRMVDYANYLTSLEGSIAVFGSAIIATWCTAYLRNNVAFYLDEDEKRIGGQFFGKPINAIGTPADRVVVMAIPEIEQFIVPKLRGIYNEIDIL